MPDSSAWKLPWPVRNTFISPLFPRPSNPLFCPSEGGKKRPWSPCLSPMFMCTVSEQPVLRLEEHSLWLAGKINQPLPETFPHLWIYYKTPFLSRGLVFCYMQLDQTCDATSGLLSSHQGIVACSLWSRTRRQLGMKISALGPPQGCQKPRGVWSQRWGYCCTDRIQRDKQSRAGWGCDFECECACYRWQLWNQRCGSIDWMLRGDANLLSLR